MALSIIAIRSAKGQAKKLVRKYVSKKKADRLRAKHGIKQSYNYQKYKKISDEVRQGRITAKDLKKYLKRGDFKGESKEQVEAYLRWKKFDRKHGYAGKIK